MSKFFQGIREQSVFMGVIRHFFSRSIQNRFLGIREILEISPGSMGVQNPLGGHLWHTISKRAKINVLTSVISFKNCIFSDTK